MQLLDHHIDEFIALYKKHYGVILERAVALEKGMGLVRLIELAHRPSAQINEAEYGRVNS